MTAPPCPTPWKVKFASRGEAKSSARAAARHTSPSGQLRPYRCECGEWHLTTMPSKIRAAVKRAQRKRRAA